MKKLICIFLILCLCSSSIFANPVEKKYHTWVLIPAFLTSMGCWYLTKNPPIWHDKGLIGIEKDGIMYTSNGVHKNPAPAIVCGFVTAFLVLVAITPSISSDGKTTYIKAELKF